MLTDKLCTHSAVTTSCAGSVQMFENSFRELPLGKNMVHILNLFSFRRWLWSRGRGWGKERSNRREWKERVREWIKTDQFEPVIMTPWIPAAVFLLPPPENLNFGIAPKGCYLLHIVKPFSGQELLSRVPFPTGEFNFHNMKLVYFRGSPERWILFLCSNCLPWRRTWPRWRRRHPCVSHLVKVSLIALDQTKCPHEKLLSNLRNLSPL